MIKVTYGNNISQQNFLCNPEQTIIEFLTQHSLPYNNKQLHLDGTPLNESDIHKPFSHFVSGDSCCLINIAKTADG